MSELEPTDEQTDVIGLFLSGINLAVEAGAGTGKTTTLGLLARNTRRSGSYVAFNRSIVNEAKQKMPMNVLSSTAHSLAYRSWGCRFEHRIGSDRVKSWELARLLDVGHVVVSYGGQKKVLQPSFLAGHVMRGIRNFCASADPAPSPLHLPYIPGIDPPDDQGRRTWTNNDALRAHLADTVDAAWADLLDVEGRLPFSHDHYLKQWTLNDPVIPGEFVLFDEAQDASPVMLAAVEHQITRGSQVVFVGDSQQSIYGWRGAVNALASVPADATTYLTQSWRFGPKIAGLANVILDRLDADLRLVGSPRIESTLGYADHPDAILTRGNSAALEHLLHAQRAGKHAHLIGGGGELLSFAKGVADLQAKGRSSHPDLACFESWGEVKEYVEKDALGDELVLMVRLIEEYGLQIVVDALDGMVAEVAADVVISTAHKAKGREWDTVKLAADFPDPTMRGDTPEEWRLLYVAVTRAKLHLDVSAVDPIRTLLAPRPVLASAPTLAG